MVDICTLIFLSSDSIKVVKASYKYEINRKTVSAVYAKLYLYVSEYYIAGLNRFGGLGIVCQIDESLVCYKRNIKKKVFINSKMDICNGRYKHVLSPNLSYKCLLTNQQIH
ncbi:hypothetical protein H312_03462 [Anncaliia algerae PRA339]|uniref:Uncharacterized protein n=1 Tax=Anncaliia algerae PRA339 TaxID=1288291 RepID=A0A059EVW3_9MICR|nr:hypothetical protein H312_03462 [Anncaliia algerae PRA339]